MDLQGRARQREKILSAAVAWADEAAQLMSEANGIVFDEYYGLVAMIEEDATPEELTQLADIWAASSMAIEEAVCAVARAKQEIASIEASGVDIARADEAWLAHRAANVARSLVKAKSLCARMGEGSEEYNRICASIRMRDHPHSPES